MAENLQPETLTTWMRDVERRLRAVESAPKLLTAQYGSVRKQSDAFVAVTSATFVITWEVGVSQIVNDSFLVQTTVVADAGTTGEVRLYAPSVSGTPVTAVASIPAGVQRFVRFAWLVPDMIVGTNTALFQVQARRTAGAGAVNVFYPDAFMAVSGFEFDADNNGNVTVTAP
jgi:hypothetical protein